MWGGGELSQDCRDGNVLLVEHVGCQVGLPYLNGQVGVEVYVRHVVFQLTEECGADRDKRGGICVRNGGGGVGEVGGDEKGGTRHIQEA